MNFDGLLKGLSSPMGSFGLGLLANSRDQYGNFAPTGQVLGSALNDVYLQQQAQALYERQQQALQQQQAQQQWMAQNMPGLANAPSMVQQEAAKAMYAKPEMPTGMRQNPDGSWAYDPAYLRGQEQLRRAGATSVKIDNAPKLPPGYMPKDPSGDLRLGVEPIPGSKEAREAADARGQVRNAMDVAQDGITLLNQMLEHPGLPYAVGTSSMLPIVPGTPPADFDALAKQMEGKAFLQAFESLKGGGQITQIEGEKATAAMARLQRAQSEKEYKASLRELRNIYQRAFARAQSRYRQSGSQGNGWTVEEIQ